MTSSEIIARIARSSHTLSGPPVISRLLLMVSLCPLWLISFRIAQLGLYRLFNRKHMRRTVFILCLALCAAAATQAQVKTVAEYIDQAQAISNRSDLKAANDYIDRTHEAILREWIA